MSTRTDQQFADLLARVEAADEADVLADVIAAAEARGRAEGIDQGRGDLEALERRWRAEGRAEVAAKVERLADEFEGKSDEEWNAYKHGDPASDHRRANPYNEGVSHAYMEAANRFRLLVRPRALVTEGKRVDVSAIACSCDADLVPPHPAHLPWPAAPAGQDETGAGR